MNKSCKIGGPKVAKLGKLLGTNMGFKLDCRVFMLVKQSSFSNRFKVVDLE